MKAYGVGIIGVGFGQYVLLPAFRSHPACSVEGLAASTHESALAAATAAEVPKAYEHWHQLVEAPQIDIVAIAVTPALQPEIIAHALACGKHVFAEKPLALTAQISQSLLDQPAHETVVGVDLEFPEVPAWQALKEVVDRGELGELRHIQLSWQVETYAYRHGLSNWKTDSSLGGGALYGFASHSLYSLEWLFGTITAVLGALRHEDESWMNASLRFASGIEGSLCIACNSPAGTGHRLDIYGTQGSAFLHNPSNDYIRGFELTVRMRDATAKSWPVADLAAGTDGRVAAVSAVIERFLSCIATGSKMIPGLAEGHRVGQLMDALRESAERGWVNV